VLALFEVKNLSAKDGRRTGRRENEFKRDRATSKLIWFLFQCPQELLLEISREMDSMRRVLRSEEPGYQIVLSLAAVSLLRRVLSNSQFHPPFGESGPKHYFARDHI
jgi:hypothetical protein